MAVVDIPSLGAAAALSTSDLMVVTQGSATALKSALANIVALVNADRIAGVSAFGSIGAAASYTNKLWLVTDIGIAGGSLWISNGTVWRPAHSIVLARSAVQAPPGGHTGGTSETTLATIAVPANAMGLNGGVAISALFSNNNSGNNKTARIRFNNATTGTIYGQVTQTTNQSQRFIDSRITNRNSASSQVGFLGAGSFVSSAAPVTSSENTGSATNIYITGQLANSADNIALEHYTAVLEP